MLNTNLSTKDGCWSAISRSFNMCYQFEQILFVISTGSREVSRAAKVSSSCVVPDVPDVFEQFLFERPRNLCDHLVEVNLTRQNSVQLFVDSDNLQSGRNACLGDSADSLSSDTLSTISGFVYYEQVGIFYFEYRLVAQGNISEVNEVVEEVTSLETFDNSYVENFFQKSKETSALAVSDCFII